MRRFNQEEPHSSSEQLHEYQSSRQAYKSDLFSSSYFSGLVKPLSFPLEFGYKSELSGINRDFLAKHMEPTRES